jgi:hypothetical protein
MDIPAGMLWSPLPENADITDLVLPENADRTELVFPINGFA